MLINWHSVIKGEGSFAKIGPAGVAGWAIKSVARRPLKNVAGCGAGTAVKSG
ncbi:hypothetical protein KXZ74_25805, partial [Escherichia coli]|nr:hypothetical protein [Escherichia coli]